MTKEDNGEIPEIQFLDSENFRGGDKNALTFPSIVANQVNRVAVAANKRLDEPGDDFPSTVMSLASLMKKYIKAHPDVHAEMKTIQDRINAIQLNYRTKKESWLKKNNGKVTNDTMQYTMINFSRDEARELKEEYLELFAVLNTLWGDEGFFAEEGGASA